MEKNLIKLLFLIFLAINRLNASEPSPKFKDLTILVHSCDKYSELWEPFFKILFNKWPTLKTTNINVPIVLMANSKSYPDSRVITAQNPNEQSWAHTMLEALQHVKTKYILILLDDYFITHFDEKRLYELLSVFAEDDISNMNILNTGNDNEKRLAYERVKGVVYKNKFEPWRTSLQAVIWRTADLRHLIKPDETAWNFEIEGSVRSQGMMGKFLTVMDAPPINYLNITQGGYVNVEGLQIANKTLGINWQPKTLPLDKDHSLYLWYQRRFKPYLYYSLFVPIKGFIKSMISVF